MPSLQKNPQWGVTSKRAFLIFIQGDIIIFKNFRHYITEISVMKFQKFHQEISEIMKFQKFHHEISERWNFITEISEISIITEISEILIEISSWNFWNFCDEIPSWNFWNFCDEILSFRHDKISSQKFQKFHDEISSQKFQKFQSKFQKIWLKFRWWNFWNFVMKFRDEISDFLAQKFLIFQHRNFITEIKTIFLH